MSTPTVTSLRTGQPTCASSAAARNPTPARNCHCSKRSTAGATNSSPPTPPAPPPSSSKPATDHTPASRTRQTNRAFSPTVCLDRGQPGVVCGPRPSRPICCAGCACSALDGPLAKAEPKTLRYRLLHTAARIVRGQRKRTIRIPKPGPGPRNYRHACSCVRPAPTNLMLIDGNPCPLTERPHRARGTRRPPDATVGPPARTGP